MKLINPTVKRSAYGVGAGYFASFSEHKEDNNSIRPFRKDNNGEWYSCREQFLKYDFNEKKSLKEFLFAHSTGARARIQAFITKIEDKLNLTEENRLRIVPTAGNDSSVIEVSAWWEANRARREIVTIFLRLGQSYDPTKDNFNQALYSHAYTQNTKQAVEFFLEGRTGFVNEARMTGWVNAFSETNAQAYKNRSMETYLNAMGALNNNYQNLVFTN